MDDQDVIDGFQGLGKHGHKKGTLSLYEKYNTQQGGRGALIELIKDEKIWCACYIITGKVMKNYTRGECTLDAIAVAEFVKNGTRMNWCQYLLTEMFQACVDVHDRMTYFIYGYLLISFAMWKWKPS
jgi:hypothetical protein